MIKRGRTLKTLKKKRNSWVEISRLMGNCSGKFKIICSICPEIEQYLIKITVDDVMNRWKHLREKYIRCAKKPASGNAASTSERDWEYYSSLKWLDAYIIRHIVSTLYALITLFSN
jgi:hypothetical protein